MGHLFGQYNKPHQALLPSSTLTRRLNVFFPPFILIGEKLILFGEAKAFNINEVDFSSYPFH